MPDNSDKSTSNKSTKQQNNAPSSNWNLDLANYNDPNIPPNWIGIWAPKFKDGQPEYRRTVDRNWRWSNMKTIPTKSDKKRVVYLGESVARGFFFDPEYCPAQALNGMLNHWDKNQDRYEVIDLAAIDLLPLELISLLQKVPQLQPDAIVIFAGNNWIYNVHQLVYGEDTQRRALAEQVKSKGVSVLTKQINSAIPMLIQNFFMLLKKISLQLNIPITIVIPEFNLLDWNDNQFETAPWLCNKNDNSQWFNDYKLASEKYEKGDYHGCIKLADKLIQLDKGTSEGSHRLQAMSYQKLEQYEQARLSFEKARDARIWETSSIPKCYKVIQQTLRGFNYPNIHIVDLPEIFKAYCDNGLPNRQLFMDYCHLSVKGIEIAMSAISRNIFDHDNNDTVHALSIDQIIEITNTSPSASIESEAHLLAAIHNAHLGQKDELIGYHIQRAADLDPNIIKSLQHYLNMQGRRTNPLLTTTIEEISNHDQALMFHYLSSYNSKRLYDRVLLNKINDYLSTTNNLLPNQSLADIRQNEWAVTPNRIVDLLAEEYKTSSHDSQWPCATRDWYNCYVAISIFHFSSVESIPLIISINCRLGQFIRSLDKVEVLVNQQSIYQFEPTTQWTLTNLKVPPNVVVKENTLSIKCSPATWDNQAALQAIAKNIASNQACDKQPSLIEINNLLVFYDFQ